MAWSSHHFSISQEVWQHIIIGGHLLIAFLCILYNSIRHYSDSLKTGLESQGGLLSLLSSLKLTAHYELLQETYSCVLSKNSHLNSSVLDNVNHKV